MQTWKTLDVPKNWIEATLSLQHSLKNSNYVYVFLTDVALDDFVHSEYPELFRLFLALPYSIQRADVGRYLWLHKFGGIYIDMDYHVLKPFVQYLDSLTADLVVLHSSNIEFIITNSLIKSRKGLQLFYDLACESLRNPLGPWWAITKHLHIMSSTGPLAFHNKIVSSELAYVSLPNKLFLNYSTVKYNQEKIESNAFMKPIEGASWNSFDTLLYNFVNSFKRIIIALLVCFLMYNIINMKLLQLNMSYLLKHIRKNNKKSNIEIREKLEQILNDN